MGLTWIMGVLAFHEDLLAVSYIFTISVAFQVSSHTGHRQPGDTTCCSVPPGSADIHHVRATVAAGQSTHIHTRTYTTVHTYTHAAHTLTPHGTYIHTCSTHTHRMVHTYNVHTYIHAVHTHRMVHTHMQYTHRMVHTYAHSACSNVWCALQVRDTYRKWWRSKVAESEFLSSHFGELSSSGKLRTSLVSPPLPPPFPVPSPYKPLSLRRDSLDYHRFVPV